MRQNVTLSKARIHIVFIDLFSIEFNLEIVGRSWVSLAKDVFARFLQHYMREIVAVTALGEVIAALSMVVLPVVLVHRQHNLLLDAALELQ